jgi:acetolactate decarboxylase
MKKILLAIVVIIMTTGANVIAQKSKSQNNKSEKKVNGKVYKCPMKCEGEKTYGKPGKCPVCKMDLEEIKKVFHCPMKCEGEKTYDNPGKCSVCGMNLEELKKEDALKGTMAGVDNPNVKIVGMMKNVMMKGELFATIDLDTIANKKHLYGMGPVEYLTGEITILDGKLYKSVVVSPAEMKVTSTGSFKVKAPFLGYTNVTSWNEVKLPDTISTIQQLESFLDQTTATKPRLFFFKVNAIVDSATIHVVNLPDGTKETPQGDMHHQQTDFPITNQSVEILGFYSKNHQGIFTHRSTDVHMHLITADKSKMGHLDKMKIKKGTAMLYLPAE